MTAAISSGGGWEESRRIEKVEGSMEDGGEKAEGEMNALSS